MRKVFVALTVLILFTLAFAQPVEIPAPDFTGLQTSTQDVACSGLNLANIIIWAVVLFSGLTGLFLLATKRFGPGLVSFGIAIAVSVLYTSFVGVDNLTRPLGGCTPFN